MIKLPEPPHCKYGNIPAQCTLSPMDCQCAIDAVAELNQETLRAKMEDQMPDLIVAGAQALRTLESLGYTYHNGELWEPAARPPLRARFEAHERRRPARAAYAHCLALAEQRACTHDR